MFSISCRIIYNNSPKLRIVASGFHSSQVNNGDVPSKQLSIREFYRGKSVFMTGGSGFLGKVFIQKLLDIPELDKIYLLMRAKKGAKIEDRIQEVYNCELFTQIKQTRPQDLKKIVPIAGDVALPNLGISDGDENILREKVSVVIHSAATVRFFEKLNISMNINVEGTKRILDLCKRIKNLEAFVHISTAYSNAEKRVIEERVYPPPHSIEEVYRFIEKGYDSNQLKEFLCGKPNTYVLTKSIAEKYVEDNHGDVPAAIVRPSVVTATAKPPVVGWLDNWAGVSRIGVDVAKGFARVVPGRGTNLLDMIPVDYCANLTLAAAAKCPQSRKLTVYHSCSTGVNPATSDQFYRAIIDDYVKSGQNVLPFPTLLYGGEDRSVKVWETLLQTIPAHIADYVLKLMGRTPKWVKLNERVIVFREAMKPFSKGEWVFVCRNSSELQEELAPDERDHFPLAPTDIHWPTYLRDYSRGMRKYLVY